MFQKLKEVIAEERTIKWKQFAKECGLNSLDGGARVKHFALEKGLDISKLEETANFTRKLRRIMPRSQGRISYPCPPALEEVNDHIKQMLAEGKLNIRQPCVPITLERYMPDGNIEVTQVHGNKIPMNEIRQKLLNKQLKNMRLNKDENINNIPTSEIKSVLNKHTNIDTKSLTRSELESSFKILERTRNLVMWHDHSTLRSYGLLLITIKTVYDPAVFYTNEELKSTDHEKLFIQEIIEKPEIHIVGFSTSSPSSQANFIPDRLDCLTDLNEIIKTPTGIVITDNMRFFIDDKPAVQFERGTQQGGNFPCSCGVHLKTFKDQAVTLRHSPKSLKEMQKGTFGKQPNVLKPFSRLTKSDILMELDKRGHRDVII